MADRDSMREVFAAYARTGDVVLRDQLVAAHMGLAAYLARRFANRGQPLDDLVQVASVGLLKAVDRFDPGLGVEFSTYATTTIVGRAETSPPRPGLGGPGPTAHAGPVPEPEPGDRHPEPGARPLPEHRRAGRRSAGFRGGRAGGARSRPGLPLRLPGRPRPRRLPSTGDLGDRLGQEDAELARAEERATLDPLLERLPHRQRQVVQLRFFDGLTQSEIARRLGISQMQVSRLLTKSVAQLRSLARPSRAGHRPRRLTCGCS